MTAAKTQFTTSELLLRISVTDILDVQDVALLLKRSEARIRHLVSAREIPHYKNESGQVTFRKSEIEEWRARGSRVLTTDELKRQAATYTALNPLKSRK